MNNQSKRTELTSWKEIAGYLGVTSRTAQNWERDRGLPVHRRMGKHGRVFAQPDEIDAWRERVAAPSQVPEERGTSPAADVPPAAGPNRNPIYLALLLAPLLIGAGAAAYWFANGPQPVRWRFDDNSVVVLGQNGSELWRKNLDDEFPDSGGAGGVRSRGQILVQDFDSDGQTEVVLSVTGIHDDAYEGELVCFSAKGFSKWRFRTRDSFGTARKPQPGDGRDAVNFAYADFGLPVGKAFVVVMNYPDAPQIALVSPRNGQLLERAEGKPPRPAPVAPAAASQLDQLYE